MHFCVLSLASSVKMEEVEMNVLKPADILTILY